jgi:hypothetical protein
VWIYVGCVENWEIFLLLVVSFWYLWELYVRVYHTFDLSQLLDAGLPAATFGLLCGLWKLL